MGGPGFRTCGSDRFGGSARRGPRSLLLAQNNTYPWKLYATASTHVGIMGGLAGFAFTGVVLCRDSRARPARHRREFARYSHRDVLGGLSLVGRQRLSDFLHSARRDKRRVRAAVITSLASTIEYRTVFLSWFALLPLLEANGLGRLAYVLYFLLPASLLFGSVLIAMCADGLGSSCGYGERSLSAAVSTILALGYAAIVAFVVPTASVPVLFAGPRPCYLLYQRLVLHARSAHTAVAAICRRPRILQAAWQADCHCRHAVDDGIARVPLA